MPPSDEDKRQSVGITVTLSSQIMSAALAMLSVHAAFVTFLADKRVVGPAFRVAAAVAFVGFILGIFFGGRGIRTLSYAGADGTWQLTKGKPAFNKQAIFSLIGIVAFGVSVVAAGPTRKEPSDQRAADSALVMVRIEQASLRRSLDSLKLELTYVRGRLGAAIENPAARAHEKPSRRP